MSRRWSLRLVATSRRCWIIRRGLYVSLAIIAALGHTSQADSLSTIHFDEATDTIQVAGQTNLGWNCTYEARVYFPAAGSFGNVFNEWTLGIEDKQFLAGPARLTGWNHPVGGFLEEPASVSTGSWRHVAFVQDDAAGQQRLYLDGQLVTSQSASGDIGDGAGGGFVGALSRDGGLRASFVGYLDTLRISNIVRYSGTSFSPPLSDLSPDGNTLILYNFSADEYFTDEGYTKITDLSGNGHHGSLGAGFIGATSPEAAGVPVAVGGTVRFVADDGQTYPAKFVEVAVYDDNGILPDEFIVSGHTDANGDFYFDVDSNGEPIWNEDSIPFGGARDIYVEIAAKNEAAVVSSTAVGLPYRGETETITQPQGGLINFGTIVFSEENSAAFGFLAPARVARDWVGNNTGFWPDSKRVVYPDDNAPRWESTAPGSIRMDNNPAAPYSDERMSEFFHEYGHGVHDEVRPGYGLPGGEGAGFDGQSDEGAALSEGWAEFFQTAVEHGPSDSPPSGHWYWNRIESGAFWQGKDANMVEGSTACVLWDLYDIANDDGIDQQLSRIWAVMADWDNPPDRLWSPTGDDDFYTYWVTHYGLDQPGNEAEWRAFDEVFIDHGIAVRDDDGEENNTKAEAFDLGTVDLGDTEHPNLICVNDDWWKFTIAEPSAPGDRVMLRFDQNRGDIDLAVYDSLDQSLGDAVGSNGLEMVPLSSQPAGTYYIEVVGHNGDYSPNYKLTISLSSSISAVPTVVDLPAAYDTGRYDSDDVTTLDTPHIAGFAAPNSTIRVYVGLSGSYTLVGSDAANSNGVFDVALTTPLDEGANEITATAEEPGRTESEHSSPPLVVTLDTDPPDSPSQPDMTAGSDSGRFLNDDITSSQTPTFEGTSEPDAEVTLYEGATPLGSAVTADGAWSVTASALGEGTHQISATATDAAGNESGASSALSILTDLTPPDISDTSVTPDGCRPVGIVFDLSITATDALSGMADAWSPEATVRNGSMSVDIVLPPAGGDEYAGSWDSEGADPDDYGVDFEAFDLAGNSTLIEDAATICLALPGDHDFDGDVDLLDFARFQVCFTGEGGAAPAGCEMMKTDEDDDVDLGDFEAFEANLTGPQ